jgi:hypothetical protein
MLHSDCGAYGGIEAFGGNTESERAHHKAELLRAASNLSAAIPGLIVDCYFVDFEGVWTFAA